MRISILCALLLFTLVACKQQTTTVQSSTSSSPNVQSGSCTIGKWTNLSSPLNLKISTDFSTELTNAGTSGGLNVFEQMAKVWNDALTPTVTLFKVPMSTTNVNIGSYSLSNFRDGEMGIYKINSWFSGISHSALAITQFYGVVSSDPTLGSYVSLSHADILVNYDDFGADFTLALNPLVDYDLPTVLLHELGHFSGLCHESSHTSIMAPYYVTTQRSLKTFDRSKIQALYINNQNYNAISANPANVNALESPVGTEVKGIVELNADGNCRHFINGKLIYEHQSSMAKLPRPNWYKNLPYR